MRMSDEISISVGKKSWVKLPKVVMSNGVGIWYFDPYNMQSAYVLVNEIDQLIKSNDTWMYKIDTVVVPATKPICYAWDISYKIHADLVVLKKERKPYHTEVMYFDRSEDSMTTNRRNSFFIEVSEADKIRNKNVLFFDDVISTGSTWRAAKAFLEKLEPNELRSLFLFKEGNMVDDELGVYEKYIGEIPLIK